MRCAVIGAGAWGSALSILLARGGNQVRLWAREAEVVASINERRENTRFLPGVTIDASVQATGDAAEALAGSTLVVYVAPSHVLREVVRAGAPCVPGDAIVVVATKGLEPESLALMTDVVSGELPSAAVVAISGPSFAIEVARGQPTALVAASHSAEAAKTVQRTLSSPVFRVYTNDDVTGVELAGALKNVMAVATGIADGLELGLNTRAALITRGLAEMTRLGIALGARAETFFGLAGLGDLVLTCTGALSRNRTVGLEIGRGRALDDVIAGSESVAEGVRNTTNARALARRAGVEMPIVATVHRILFEGQSAQAGLEELMTRDLRPERDA
jgi:glycerol-3-phosphate dehydrogenase (NAD(P)+)